MACSRGPCICRRGMATVVAACASSADAAVPVTPSVDAAFTRQLGRRGETVRWAHCIPFDQHHRHRSVSYNQCSIFSGMKLRCGCTRLTLPCGNYNRCIAISMGVTDTRVPCTAATSRATASRTCSGGYRVSARLGCGRKAAYEEATQVSNVVK